MKIKVNKYFRRHGQRKPGKANPPVYEFLEGAQEVPDTDEWRSMAQRAIDEGYAEPIEGEQLDIESA